jgi:hypothetical protein
VSNEPFMPAHHGGQRGGVGSGQAGCAFEHAKSDLEVILGGLGVVEHGGVLELGKRMWPAKCLLRWCLEAR